MNVIVCHVCRESSGRLFAKIISMRRASMTDFSTFEIVLNERNLFSPQNTERESRKLVL